MIADVLQALDGARWDAPTLCTGWTVRHVAAHLIQPMVVTFARFFLTALRHRGDTDATVDHLTRRLARTPPPQLLTLLRQHAPDQVSPFRVGPMGPFAETCVHLRDVARPLGLTADVPAEDWRTLLDYFTSPAVAPALIPAGRLAGLTLTATDTDWSAGHGPEIRGPVEALAMAAAGRTAAVADLRGAGLRTLESRLRIH
ncbi:maleylpyruvate isomerase family mycothiol-dependent enzyme [Dactylosporangium aurantiacum]|nr:maleylpyruvate isomerase family mycothiol-dependent enzyme [Dactylosporangium aurantiacum]MDG6107720.1 maleylpyruvate isomerase family mycothiol-dependent enzyme [Dactylosporangium aurantiacum]